MTKTAVAISNWAHGFNGKWKMLAPKKCYTNDCQSAAGFQGECRSVLWILIEFLVNVSRFHKFIGPKVVQQCSDCVRCIGSELVTIWKTQKSKLNSIELTCWKLSFAAAGSRINESHLELTQWLESMAKMVWSWPNLLRKLKTKVNQLLAGQVTC